MVREEERVGGDVPGIVPLEILLVQENTHQLGDRERRVRLNRNRSASESDSFFVKVMSVRRSTEWRRLNVRCGERLVSIRMRWEGRMSAHSQGTLTEAYRGS